MHIVSSLLASTMLAVSLRFTCVQAHAEETRSPQPVNELLTSTSLADAPKLSVTPTDDWPTATHKKFLAAITAPSVQVESASSLTAGTLALTNAVIVPLVDSSGKNILHRPHIHPGANTPLGFVPDMGHDTDGNYRALERELHKRAYLGKSSFWYSPAKGLGVDLSTNWYADIQIRKMPSAELAVNF